MGRGIGDERGPYPADVRHRISAARNEGPIGHRLGRIGLTQQIILRLGRAAESQSEGAVRIVCDANDGVRLAARCQALNNLLQAVAANEKVSIATIESN